MTSVLCDLLYIQGKLVSAIAENNLSMAKHTGLSPGRREAIIWTNTGILLIDPQGTNFSEIFIEIYTFFIQENAFENIVCETAAILSRPKCGNGWFTGSYRTSAVYSPWGIWVKLTGV